MDNNPDPACWDWGGHSIPAHELIHMLGAVGNGAPNTTGHGHCTDEWDTECYSDYPNYPAMRLVCSSDQEALLDCNNNDYFAVNPAPNSYLTQYWNTANSAFLTGPLVTPSPSVSPTPAALPPDTTITAKPASPTNATSASFSFSATVAGSTFECALDAAAYAACTSPKVYNPIAEGNHTFAVRARNAAGVDASPAQATVLVDRTAPVATAPVQSIVIGSTLPRVDVNTVTVPLKLTWSATDAGSGVASYVLRTSTNLGVTWTTISPASFTATTMTVQVRPGSTFTYQVMATDRAGNAGAFATGPNMLIAGYQQDHAALVYRGTTAWSNGSSTSYWSGADKYTTTANNSVTFTVSNVRTVAWISYRNTTMGKAAIYLDGSTTAAATVDLYATAAQFRYVIWSKTWATAGNHTIKVVVLGTAGRPRVDVDAFVALHDQ